MGSFVLVALDAIADPFAVISRRHATLPPVARVARSYASERRVVPPMFLSRARTKVVLVKVVS